jgi:hypothetical protein
LGILGKVVFIEGLNLPSSYERSKDVNTDIEKYNNITAIVDGYNSALADISTGFEALGRAKKTLRSILGEYSNGIFQDRLSDFEIGSDSQVNASKKYITKNAWSYILQKYQIFNLVSNHKKEEIERQIRHGDLPPFTVESVMVMMDGLRTNISSLLDEAIKEVFEFLRPHRNHYKTNSEFEVGSKVILEYYMDVTSWSIHLSYTRDQNIRCLDNVFSLLDGKGPVKYPGDLLTTMRSAFQEKRMGCETKYFKVKWFKKGTLHIEFKRLDLLSELNRIGGGNRLKPGA